MKKTYYAGIAAGDGPATAQVSRQRLGFSVPAPLFGIRLSRRRIPTSAGPLLLSEDVMADVLMRLAGIIVFSMSVFVFSVALYCWSMQ